MSVSLRENITAVIETCFSETKEEIQEAAIDKILELIRTDKAEHKTEPSEIIEAYSRGFEDGAEAAKAVKIKALHKDYVEPYVAIEDEPQTDCPWK